MSSQRFSPISPRRLLVRAGARRAPDVPGRAFPWLSAGLFVSAVTSWLAGSSPEVGRMAVELALPLIIGQVVFVIAIDAVIPVMGAGVAVLLLGVYSATIGLALSCLFIAGDLGSVATAFVSAAGMFGAAGVYIAATSRSLANRRGFVSLMLVGIVIAWFVNIVVFTRPVDELWISILGVAAFVGLTAWNVRKTSRADDPRAAGATAKGSVAALVLYLEVINAFLDLARQADRIVGDTREDPAWNARHGFPTDRQIRPR
jgi:uncharacterized protein